MNHVVSTWDEVCLVGQRLERCCDIEGQRQTERENGTESSRTSSCPSASSSPNPNCTYVGAAIVGFREFVPADVVARRSYRQRGGHRKSPLCRQELPQSRSFQGLTFLFPCLPLIVFFCLFPWKSFRCLLSLGKSEEFHLIDTQPRSILFFFSLCGNEMEMQHQICNPYFPLLFFLVSVPLWVGI